MTTRAIGNRRLLRAAKILDTADAKHKRAGEPLYLQRFFTHPCGTPACTLGHYAAHTPKRWAFDDGKRPYLTGAGDEAYMSHDSFEDACVEFDISLREAELLFGARGCNSATTAAEAAVYIRRFVRQREQNRS